MSLNKFTDTSIKQYLNIGCDKINVSVLKVNGVNVNSIVGQDNPTFETTNFTSITAIKNISYSIKGNLILIRFYAITLITAIDPLLQFFNLKITPPKNLKKNSKALGSFSGTFFNGTPLLLQDANIDNNGIINIDLISPNTIQGGQNIYFFGSLTCQLE